MVTVPMPGRYVVVQHKDPRADKYPGYWTGADIGDDTRWKKRAESIRDDAMVWENKYLKTEKRTYSVSAGWSIKSEVGAECWGVIRIDEPEENEWGEVCP